jgi:hypothetical protein
MRIQYYSIFVLIVVTFCAFVLKKEKSDSEASSGPIDKACICKGKKMYGKVQFVTSFPDVKVQYVNSFPDLKVQMVNSFPDKCGQWQVVTSFPDVKIQIVESFPDVKIQIVESFPGQP